MNVTAKSMENAVEIQRNFEDLYAQAETVVGVGIGLNSERDNLALNVQVSDRASVGAFPKTYKGLEVVVNVVGPISAF